ncbi:flagellar protein FlaG [Alkalihalobacillus hemicellulosilyticus]|uniref:Flagellar protein n=1 Tax=Halalkalibacter hemicellulosilyticusJCM 9152 TaxID=1236971 RepID=W4QI32_9BACI|nr:flagellar protein FlaG [Halalkalibacter hemicellulosilyticus]GAE31552.1 flagellar protein [Halalkalibacter hemicellulosilyticusJCM 9152]
MSIQTSNSSITTSSVFSHKPLTNEAVEVVQHDLKQKESVLPQAKEERYNRTYLEEQVEVMNDFLEVSQKSYKFHIHDDLNRLYVQVVDRQTEEVIREVPPEDFLDMFASMLKQVGLLVDKRI